MKIVCTSGVFHDYTFPDDEPLHQEQMFALLSRHVKPDGNIDDLCLDFCGRYVPIAHQSELRLVCGLVVAYAISREAAFNEVSVRIV